MKKYLVIGICLFLFSDFFAQDVKQKQKIDDSFQEMESGELALRFFDALTGNPIANANVEFDNGETLITDFEGKILFIPSEDNYTCSVKFIHPNYITSNFKIEIMAGSLFFNRFSISPKMPFGSTLIVIDWGEKPADLDAHFVKKDNYHISFRNMRVSQDGISKLDRDDTDGFGPETITTKNIDKNAEYIFFVNDFSNLHNSNSAALSDSKCSVKIYGNDNELINVFYVPQNVVGNYWNVFNIVDGDIIPVNKISQSEIK